MWVKSGKRLHKGAGKLQLIAGFTLALVAALWGASVRADGPARPIRPAEAKFIMQVLGAIDQALPPGPRGWEQTERSKVEAPRHVTEGAEQSPLGVDYHIVWKDLPRLRAAGDKAVQAGAGIMRRQQEDKSLQALQREFEALAAKLGEAYRKNDLAQAQRIQAEMEAAAQKLEKAHGAYDQEVKRALAANEARDAIARIDVLVNVFSESPPSGMAAAPPAAGLIAYRSPGQQDGHRGWQEGETLVLAGPWTLNPDGGYLEAKPRPGLPHTAAQTLLVRVRADEARAGRILQAMDWAKLKGLLAK